MKKTIFSILLFLIWFFGFTFADLEFTNYQILGQIQNDWTINVQENIDVHFFTQMHWIERMIPLTYTVQDTEFQVFVDNIDVLGYNYKIMDDYYDTNIRIWDADKYVYWDKKYEINYSIYWLIRNFSGMWYSELYWNVVWYDRSNSIQSTQIELTLPKAYTWLTKDDFLITAWYSDKKSIDEFDWEVKRDENKIYITYNKKLDSYNWITLTIRFPNNYFEFDHERQASLLVWYTHDFNIKNYKLYWTVEENGNIKFQNNIELEILNKDPRVEWLLPYFYHMDSKNYLVFLNDITVNWLKINTKEKENGYITDSISHKWIYISWDFNEINSVSWTYSIYWLVRPFFGEYEDWAYRMFLPIPILDLLEWVNNIELILDIPWWCENLYQEDISVKIWWDIIWINEFNEKYGHIRCHDNKFAMTYSGETLEMNLMINFVKWTFELDEELLAWLAALWDGQFYYTDKTNRQSILFAIWILLFWWWFKALMKKRYKNQSMMDNKYPIYFDAPKWVDSPEAWVLVDNRIDPKDITALIYQRAANHYIKLYRENSDEKEFYIKKIKQLPWTSKKYQLNLFNSLFKDSDEFHFSKNRSKLSDYLSTAQKELNSFIKSENRYKKSFFSWIWSSFKRQNATLVFWTAILWFIPYFWILTALSNHFVPVSNRIKIVCFVSFILIVTSYRNYWEETNTKKWQEARNHCLWFRDFLMKVDKVKLETLLKEDPLYIEKALPYAVVFWVDSQFIKNITPEMIKDLDWFEWDDFDLYDLTRSINYIQSHTTSSFYTSTYSRWYSGSYSSSWWFSSGSSFGGGHSSGWGGGGGWWGWR